MVLVASRVTSRRVAEGWKRNAKVVPGVYYVEAQLSPGPQEKVSSVMTNPSE